MKVKKILGLVLVSAMVLSSFAGCGKTTTENPQPEVTQGASTQEPAATATPAPKAVVVEEKKVSDSAANLITTVQDDFGGKLYLAALQSAYKRMMSGEYSNGQTVKANVGDKNAAGVTLNLSVLYNKLRMSYTLDDAYNAADGVTYEKGDLLPTWKKVQSDVGFVINDVTTTESSVNNNYKAVKNNNFSGVDVLCASAANANEDGQTGNFAQLDQYLEYMPNFKAFLDGNEVVKTTITAGDGHIYYAPYFDGYNDIEKTVLVRVDWVEKLLNGAFDESKFDSTAYAGSFTYTNYMPASASGADALEVKVVKADGTGVETVKKDYAKNITTVMNEVSNKNGATLVKALRDYIDTTYNGYYGDNRADLFVGQNAAWDADEMVALLRCVVANPKFLTNGASDVVYGFFGREATLQRVPDLFTLACNMFGVRGADAEKDYLYFDANGNLCDGRQSTEYYYAIEKLGQLYADGLLLKDFDLEGAGGAAGTKVYDTMYKDNLGFGLYDYVQTQTAYNDTVKVEGFKLQSIINPVALWATDVNGSKLTRFTESWRSVKTEGWVITTECTQDANKLAKALALFDYMYSTEGNRTMSYGPDAWIDGNNTIDYQGQQVPKLSAAALNELATLAGGNYTNYYRQYLGATFPIGYIKQQGMEYQCTTETGKNGLVLINNAILYGVLEHVQVNTADCATPFYRIIPTTFATTANENAILSEKCANLASYFSKTKGEYSVFVDAIKYGFEEALNKKAAADAAKTE
ncbi:MAG: hypothetical protein MJ124_00140 [Lachnospiraceae bacterium]|nr:hypothetical protein [Lachnospiraceae bacterium]